MAFDYGFGELGNRMIELFHEGPPDFEAAEELIRQGADLNMVGGDYNENLLSAILSHYWWSKDEDSSNDDDHSHCEDCERSCCYDCEYDTDLNPDLGPSMCQIIRFFLDHGFDVTKWEGCYGAQCLWALTLSTFDRYMIEATKILLDAGAKNRTISPTLTSICDTPKSFIDTERSYQDCCEQNHASGNLYEAVYQVYLAVEGGRPYSGIDSYEMAVGKKILKVLAESNGDLPVFYPIALPEFQKENCFTQTLYFVYDGGMLITTQYTHFWTDTVLPDAELVDVSKYFDGIVGSEIERFAFDHRSVVKDTTDYGQPITTVEMDSGRKVRFSINFGEVKEENRAAFFELI